MDNLETSKIKTLNTFVLTATSDVCDHLTKTLGKLIEMPFVRADIISLDELEGSIATPNTMVSASILPMHGEVIGVGAFIADIDDAIRITEVILGRPMNSNSKLDELSISLLMEISNIVGGMFLSRLSPKSGFRFVQDAPEHHIQTMKEAIREMRDNVKKNGDKETKSLVIDFSMSVKTDGTSASAHYFFLLDEGFLNYILEAGFTQHK